jgi:transposase
VGGLPPAQREAVRLADDLGNASKAARDLGITTNLVHRWRRQLRDGGARAFPGNGSPRDEELAQLKRELRRAGEENEILKKAVGLGRHRPSVSSRSY